MALNLVIQLTDPIIKGLLKGAEQDDVSLDVYVVSVLQGVAELEEGIFPSQQEELEDRKKIEPGDKVKVRETNSYVKHRGETGVVVVRRNEALYPYRVKFTSPDGFVEAFDLFNDDELLLLEKAPR